MSERELASYRREHVAWVSADRPSLPGYCANEFVALPLLASGQSASRARAAALDALRRAGAERCAHAPLHELSDTESRRVAIAQALVRGPRFLLLDEPVYGLGSIESRSVLGLLRALTTELGCGVLVTAADAAELLGASRVLGLSNGGRIVDPAERPEASATVVALRNSSRTPGA